MQDSSTTPHGWQIVYLAVTGVLSSLLTLIVDRIKNHSREPAEIRKIDAEAKSIHVTAENAQATVGLELLRAVQDAIEKAEVRREAWLLKEEQLRNQVLFWRNKAEELDGELADSRQANGQLVTQAKLNNHQLRKQMAFIEMKELKEEYVALDQPKPSAKM